MSKTRKNRVTVELNDKEVDALLMLVEKYQITKSAVVRFLIQKDSQSGLFQYTRRESDDMPSVVG